MSQTALVQARMDEGLKHDAEKILYKLHVKPSDIMRALYGQIILHKAVPFPIEMPNKETLASFKEGEEHEDELETFSSAAELIFSNTGKKV